MTSATRLIEMAEWFDNERLLDIIKYEKKFDPFVNVRGKSLLDTSVINNNYSIFEALLDHEKFDINKITNSHFVVRIFQRFGNADIIENRKYYNKLMELDYKITANNLFYLSKNKDLFIEVFENTEKKERIYKQLFHCIDNNSIINFLLEDLINNNFDFFNKQFIDNCLLSKAINNLDYSLILLLKEKGIEIRYCYDEHLGKNVTSLYKLLVLDKFTAEKNNKTLEKMVSILTEDLPIQTDNI